MRRISLAVALLGAVAGSGCSGGGGDPSSSGSSRGVPGSTFTVLVRGDLEFRTTPTADPEFLVTGGTVESGTLSGATFSPDGRIRCGISGAARSTECSADYPWGTSGIVLRATPSNGSTYFMFAGDCSGDGDCTLSGNADRMVLVRFSVQRWQYGHPNFSDPAVHGPAFHDSFAAGVSACAACHSPTLQGQGIALSCVGCHNPSPPPSTGLRIAVSGASIDTDAAGTTTVSFDFTVRDDQGNPIPLPAGARFALARVDRSGSLVLPYAVLTPATGNPGAITFPAVGTAAAPTGLVENAAGDYTYTSPRLPKIDAGKLGNTHTLWIQASRWVGTRFAAVNQQYSFVPSGAGTVVEREVASSAACNRCHASFRPEGGETAFHGSARIEAPYCNVCHNQARTGTRTNSDPGTAPAGTPAAASSVFVHRIHAAERMLQRITTPGATATAGYALLSSGQATSGYQSGTRCSASAPCTCTALHPCTPSCSASAPCVVADSATAPNVAVDALLPTVYSGIAEATYPQDLRSCGACHDGAAQGAQWNTRPSRAACGSCHDAVDFTGAHDGVTAPTDVSCPLCHRPADVIGYHLPVVPLDPNNILDVPTGNKRTNAAAIAAAGSLPPGAARITYDLKAVAAVADADGVLRPTVTFRFLKDGVPVAFNAPGGELMDGFVGTAQAYCAFSVPQDGVAAPADFNVAGGVSVKAIRNGTGAGTMVDGTGDDTGYYVVTLTGQRVLPEASILTCGLGYAYDLPGNQPITQTDLPAYPMNASGSGGLIVPIPNVWRTAAGYAPRRAIVDNAKCNACHAFLGVAPSFHVGQRNDGPTCAFCHNPNRANNGWAVNSKDIVHGIHGARMRAEPFTWHAAGATLEEGGYFMVTYPGQLNDCQGCHVPGTYDFVATAPAVSSLLPSTAASGTIADALSKAPYVAAGDYGPGFGYDHATGAITEAAATTLVISPITAACFSCHDGAAARAHMEAAGGLIYAPRGDGFAASAETCLGCHGVGTIAPIADVHR